MSIAVLLAALTLTVGVALANSISALLLVGERRYPHSTIF
jgi:hypothetical protein